MATRVIQFTPAPIAETELLWYFEPLQLSFHEIMSLLKIMDLKEEKLQNKKIVMMRLSLVLGSLFFALTVWTVVRIVNDLNAIKLLLV